MNTIWPALELLRSTAPLVASEYISLPLHEVFMRGLSKEQFTHFGLPDSFGSPLQLGLNINLEDDPVANPIPVTAMYHGEIKRLSAYAPIGEKDRHGRQEAFIESPGLLLTVSPKPEIVEKIELLLNDSPNPITTPTPRFVFYEGADVTPGTKLTEIFSIPSFPSSSPDLPSLGDDYVDVDPDAIITDVAQKWELGDFIHVFGHTDTRDFLEGSSIEDNEQLGRLRAETVATALKAKIETIHGPNVPEDVFFYVGHAVVSRGESEPEVLPESDDADLAKNRRVEIHLLKQRVEVQAGDIIGEVNSELKVFALNGKGLYLDPLAIPLRVFSNYQSLPFAENRKIHAPQVASRYIRYVSNESESVQHHGVVRHYLTLEDALNNSLDGDVVCLSQDANVTDANGGFPLGNGELNIEYPITLIGQNFQSTGPQPKLFASHDRRFLKVKPKVSATESSSPIFSDIPVSIYNIAFKGGLDEFGGGALRVEGIEMIVISGCKFEDCEQFDVRSNNPNFWPGFNSVSLGWGGALQIIGKKQDDHPVTSILIQQTQFNRNLALSGGAIAIANCEQVVLKDCKFNENRAGHPDKQFWEAAGARVDTDLGKVLRFNRLNEIFPESSGKFYGNGGAAYFASCIKINIENCECTENTDAAYGGAFYFVNVEGVHITGDSEASESSIDLVSAISGVLGNWSMDTNDTWAQDIADDSPVLVPQDPQGSQKIKSLINQNTATRAGGAIFAKNSAILVENTQIKDNQTDDTPGYGGGIAIKFDREGISSRANTGGVDFINKAIVNIINEPTEEPKVKHLISNSVIADNKSNFGGGVSITIGDEGDESLNGQDLMNDNVYGSPFQELIMSKCIVHNNRAYKFGGGVHCLSNKINLVDCRLSANKADSSGGGLAVLGAGEAVLEGIRFISNKSSLVSNSDTTGGGAIFALGGRYHYVAKPTIGKGFNKLSNVTLTKNLFLQNESNGSGGAIRCAQNARIWARLDNLFYANQAGRDGGAIYVENAALNVHPANWFLHNKTITINSVQGGDGGAICVFGTLIDPDDQWSRGVVYSDFFPGGTRYGAALKIEGDIDPPSITEVPQSLDDNVIFSENQAVGKGGAIHIRQRTTPPPPFVLRRVKFQFGQWRGLCMVLNIEVNKAIFAKNSAGNQIVTGKFMNGDDLPAPIQGATIAIENINFDWVELYSTSDLRPNFELRPNFKFRKLSFLLHVGGPMHFVESNDRANTVIESGFIVNKTSPLDPAIENVVYTDTTN